MTENINQNPMPEFRLFPHLDKIGGFILRIWHRTDFMRDPLATHGDHMFEHPLDMPVQPVVDWPGQQEFLGMQGFRRWQANHQPDEIYYPDVPEDTQLKLDYGTCEE